MCPNHAPQPQCPEAHDAILSPGRSCGVGRKDVPFQLWMKHCQISLCSGGLVLCQLAGLCTALNAEGQSFGAGTTDQPRPTYKYGSPHCRSRTCNLCSSSLGSRSSLARVSTSIPRNTRQVAGLRLMVHNGHNRALCIHAKMWIGSADLRGAIMIKSSR